MNDVYVSSQMTAAFLVAVAVRLLQKAESLPWITEQKKRATFIVQGVISFFAVLGITLNWNSAEHQLIIGNLSLVMIGHAGWHWIAQWATAHGWGILFQLDAANGKNGKAQTPALTGVIGDISAAIDRAEQKNPPAAKQRVRRVRFIGLRYQLLELRRRIAVPAIALVAVTSLAFSTGCGILKHSSGAPATPYENVMAWNTALAETNNSIAHGVIQLTGVTPPVISFATAGSILKVERQIAQDDDALTAILGAGPAVAKTQTARIQELLADIKSQAQQLVANGGLNVKNPSSQVQISQEIGAVINLATNITTSLAAAGVLQ